MPIYWKKWLKMPIPEWLLILLVKVPPCIVQKFPHIAWVCRNFFWQSIIGHHHDDEDAPGVQNWFYLITFLHYCTTLNDKKIVKSAAWKIIIVLNALSKKLAPKLEKWPHFFIFAPKKTQKNYDSPIASDAVAKFGDSGDTERYNFWSKTNGKSSVKFSYSVSKWWGQDWARFVLL